MPSRALSRIGPIFSRQTTNMKDMGMGDMDMGGMPGMDHAAMGHDMAAGGAAAGGMAGMDMGSGASPGTDKTAGGAMANMPGMAAPAGDAMGGMAMGGMGGMNMRDASKAPQVKMGPGVQTISPMPMDRMGEPGQGLEDVGHRVLVYRDLMAVERNPDVRAPDRAMEVHLTGNMERYMWSFDGVKLSDKREPIPFLENERVRVTLVNDTMMSHPIHLHGHFFELVTGHGEYSPRKHTVNVAPGGKVSFDVTADAVGDWAFHCHMLYHMHAGMMRVVSVRPRGEAA